MLGLVLYLDTLLTLLFIFPILDTQITALIKYIRKEKIIMAIYKISEILESLQSMMDDGFEYVDISEIEPDSNDPEDNLATLSLDAIIDDHSTESDLIDAVELPDGYFHLPE